MSKSNRDALIYTFLIFVATAIVYFLSSYAFKSSSNIVIKNGDFGSYFPSQNIKVVLYGTSWCRACASARTYLKANNVSFVEYDIDKSAEAKAQYLQLNGKTVPLLLIGNQRMDGFNAKLISEVLNKSKKNTSPNITK